MCTVQSAWHDVYGAICIVHFAELKTIFCTSYSVLCTQKTRFEGLVYVLVCQTWILLTDRLPFYSFVLGTVQKGERGRLPKDYIRLQGGEGGLGHPQKGIT